MAEAVSRTLFQELAKTGALDLPPEEAEMLRAGLKFAFEMLGADRVTIGVFENNDPAHRCYRKVGFADREVVQKDPWNVIEMEIRKTDYRVSG